MNKNQDFHRPPKIIEWLIGRIYPDQGHLTSIGDFREEYSDFSGKYGAFAAFIWSWKQIIVSFPGFFRNRFYWSLMMFQNYFKIALRTLSKGKLFSLINILGLSVGIAGAVLIILFSRHELSYDRFHVDADRLFKVYTDFFAPDGSLDNRSKGTALPVGPALEEYFPEIESSIRVHSKSAVIKVDGSLYSEPITMVDKPFFEVFSFPLKSGSPSSVFSQPYSMVITEAQAKKYFGNSDPMGKTLTLINGQQQVDFIISGIAQPPPPNSSIGFQTLIDMDSAKSIRLETNFNNWGAHGWQNFVLTVSPDSPSRMRERMTAFVKEKYGPFIEQAKQKMEWVGEGVPLSFDFQNITRMHLDPTIKGSSNLNSILILSGIACIVMMIAGINFVNISLGRASSRTKEVGMRKVLGAQRRRLIHQFWGESILSAGAALPVGFFMSAMALPLFNRLAQKNLILSHIFRPPDIFLLLGLVLMVGIAAGSYPAMVLSAFRPADIFQKKLRVGGKSLLTRMLVALQFAFSIFLMISAVVLSGQVRFLQHKDPGFSREGVIVIPTQERADRAGRGILNGFRDRLFQHPLVESVTGSHWRMDDAFVYPIVKNGKEVQVIQNHIDFDYFKTLNIDILQGRSFSPEFPSDMQSVVVNQKLLRELEIEDPIGQLLKGYYKRLTIIGVVKDYHFENLSQEILPTIHYINPALSTNYLYVRVPTTDLPASLALLKQTWQELQPDKPFRYSFLDDDLKALYSKEQRWGAIVDYATGLAVLIACLGIFGLTSIAVSNRTKEIGIRKVMGAKEFQIVGMIIREFILLVGIANLVAWPIAYYSMRTFLNNYFYRISIGPQYFILAGVLSFLAAGLTSLSLAAKAAASNPVKTLRYE